MARRIALFVFLSILLSPSYAAGKDESAFYYGIALGAGKVVEEATDADENVRDVNILLGYELLPILTLEAHAAIASGDTGSIVNEPEVTRGAGYLRLQYPGEKVLPYIMAGVGFAQYDFPARDDDEVSVAGGVGVDLFGNKTTALSIGAQVYAGDDFTYSVMQVGYRYFWGGHK